VRPSSVYSVQAAHPSPCFVFAQDFAAMIAQIRKTCISHIRRVKEDCWKKQFITNMYKYFTPKYFLKLDAVTEIILDKERFLPQAEYLNYKGGKIRYRYLPTF